MLDFFQIDIGDVRQRVISLAYTERVFFYSDTSFMINHIKRSVNDNINNMRTQVRVSWFKCFDNMSIKELESIYDTYY